MLVELDLHVPEVGKFKPINGRALPITQVWLDGAQRHMLAPSGQTCVIGRQAATLASNYMFTVYFTELNSLSNHYAS